MAAPAYLIVNLRVTNPEAYPSYTSQVPATLAPYGGRFVARGGATEVLEGDWQPGRVVVIEFPDAERARAWYHSPAYQAILPLRHANSQAEFVAIVEGVG